MKPFLSPSFLAACAVYLIACLAPTPSGNEVFLWYAWPVLLPAAWVVCMLHFFVTVGVARTLIELKEKKSGLYVVSASIAIGFFGIYLFTRPYVAPALVSGLAALVASVAHVVLVLTGRSNGTPTAAADLQR